MAQLAMLGEIWELGEVLFRLRQHSGRFYEANRSARALCGMILPMHESHLSYPAGSN